MTNVDNVVPFLPRRCTARAERVDRLADISEAEATVISSYAGLCRLHSELDQMALAEDVKQGFKRNIVDLLINGSMMLLAARIEWINLARGENRRA